MLYCWASWWGGLALAADLSGGAVAGAVGPGERVVVELVGMPEDTTWSVPWEVGPAGQHRLTVDTAAEAVVQLTGQSGAGPVSFALPVAAPPGTVRVPRRTRARAAQTEPIDVVLEGQPRAGVDSLVLAAGTGEVVGLQSAANGSVTVSFMPPPDPFPRAVPLLVVDLAEPAAVPRLGVVELGARTRIPVTTQPGTEVVVEISGRRSDPVTADASGVARVPVRVRPGETVARLELTDSAGNSSRSEIRLGGDPRPALVALATPGQRGGRAPSIVVGASAATGAAWTGEAPQCWTSLGEAVPVVAIGPGVWRGPLSWSAAARPTRVDCHLGVAAQAMARVPPAPIDARTLELRVSPATLDARSPSARVRAWVTDGVGDPLPHAAPKLSAQRGRLIVQDDSSPGTIVAHYDGQDAVLEGGDELLAAWSPPPGTGLPHHLDLRYVAGDAETAVRVRALDASGRPLRGARLTAALGGESVVVTAQDDGWTPILSLPSIDGPAPLTASAADDSRRFTTWLTPGARTGPLDAPDLTASQSITFVTGPVRTVLLRADPPVLVSEVGAKARVVLELRDGDGAPVVDQEVELSASRGTVSDLRRRADGRLEATYTPRGPGDVGRVEVVARSPTEAFPDTVTTLELTPRTARRAPGLHAGWLVGRSGLSSPWLSVDADFSLKVLPESTRLRLSTGAYRLLAEATDADTGDPLRVQAEVFPVGLGVVGLRARGRFQTSAGVSALVVPHRLTITVADDDLIQGIGLGPPGAYVHVGSGTRTRTGQIDVTVGYLLIGSVAGDGGFESGLGGVLGTVGYRLAR